LDPAHGLHELLAVYDLEPFPPERGQDRQLDHVHPERRPVEPPDLQLPPDLPGEVLRPAHLRRHRPAEKRDAGPRALPQPRAVELVVTGGGAEVPHDGLAPARQEGEARELVAGPLADGGAGDVADVVHVEAEERPQLGPGELRGQPREPLPPEAIEAHALFPVHPHRAVGGQSHQAPPDLRLGGRPLRRASTSNTTAKSWFPSPSPRAALRSSWLSAVLGRGAPTARASSRASLRSFCIIPTSNHASSGMSRTNGPRYFSIGEATTLRSNASTARSRAIPAFSARATASAKATLWTASPRLVAIFIVTASPRGPT